MENGGCHPLVCWYWLCVTQVVHWYPLASVPFFPPSACVFRAWWCSAQTSSHENKSIKTHIPYGGVQTRKTETVHKKKKEKKSRTGGERRRVGNGGWTDLQRGEEVLLAWDHQSPERSWALLTSSWLDFFSALAVIFGHIQALVDDAWDGFDLCSQLLLDPFQVEAVIVSDEVDGEAQVSEAPWMTTPQVSVVEQLQQKVPLG